MHERRLLHVQHLRNGHSPLAFFLDSSLSVVVSTSVFNRERTLSQGCAGYRTIDSSRCIFGPSAAAIRTYQTPKYEIANAYGLTTLEWVTYKDSRPLTPLELNNYDRRSVPPGSRAKPHSRQQKDTRFRPALSASPDSARWRLLTFTDPTTSADGRAIEMVLNMLLRSAPLDYERTKYSLARPACPDHRTR